MTRFDAGGFAACERLLADPALAPGADGVALASTAAAGGRAPFRIAALGGLCALALGEWPAADARLRAAAARADGAEDRGRALRLAALAAEGPRLPHRSPAWSGALSAVLPGAGQAWCGHFRDGVRHLLFDAALTYTAVSLGVHGELPGAILVGGLAGPFYVGNVIGAREAAQQFDRERRMELLARGLADSPR